MKITERITKRVREVARKLCRNEKDFDDCVQKGLFKILDLVEEEHLIQEHYRNLLEYGIDVKLLNYWEVKPYTEAYYIQGAKFKMRDYLKKERLYNEREQSNTIDLWSDTDAKEI